MKIREGARDKKAKCHIAETVFFFYNAIAQPVKYMLFISMVMDLSGTGNNIATEKKTPPKKRKIDAIGNDVSNEKSSPSK